MDKELEINPVGLAGVAVKIIPAAILVVASVYVENIIATWVLSPNGLAIPLPLHIGWMHYLIALGLAAALAGQIASNIFGDTHEKLIQGFYIAAIVAPLLALAVECFEVFWAELYTLWGVADYIDAVAFAVPIVIAGFLAVTAIINLRETPFAESFLLSGICLTAFPLAVLLIAAVSLLIALVIASTLLSTLSLLCAVNMRF